MKLHALCIALVAAGGANAAEVLRAEETQQAVHVYIGDSLFTTYTVAPDQKYPYFYPVNGPLSGASVTTETSMPYPHHHSLFFGCDKVNGGNYWQDSNEAGQILSQDIKVEIAEGEQVVFTDTCLWRQAGEEPVIRDHRRITVSAPSETIRLVDFEIRLVPLVDVTIQKTNHSLFAARMTPKLSVAEGGNLVNAAGQSGEKETFGQASPWMDYFGAREGETEGLAILQHPENRWYPAPWFTRDYGFFSPTPMYWIEGDNLTLPKGEELALRYRVVVHGGDTEAADVAGLWEAYAEGGARSDRSDRSDESDRSDGSGRSGR